MNSDIWNDERITAYVVGELTDHDKTAFEAELLQNPSLARAVDEAKMLTSNLSEMFAGEVTPPLEPQRREQIAACASHAQAAPASAAAASHSDARRWIISLAASLLLIGSIGAFWWLDQRAPGGMAVALQSPAPAAYTSSEASIPHEASIPSDVLSSQPAPSGPMDEASDLRVMPSQEKLEGSIVSAPKEKELLQEPMSRASAPESLSLPVDDARPLMRADQMAKDVSDLVPPTAPSAAVPSPVPLPMARGRSSEGPNGELGRGVQEDFAFDLNVEELSASNAMMADSPMRSIDALSLAPTASSIPGSRLAPDPLHDETISGKSDDIGGGLGGGVGPGEAGDQFEPIIENDFRRVSEEPLSTFSIDVDTASFSKSRQYLMQLHRLPPAGAIRIEEWINYFEYSYEPPAKDDARPFATRVEMAACPWNPVHRVVSVGIKGKVLDIASLPASNLVFLIDTSGSMNEPNKLPLVKESLRNLVNELRDQDRVAIVVYAGAAGMVLDSTAASDKSKILRSINQMQSGGSTNGGEGIQLAYKIAREHFIKDGNNRVLLCSDGDFNVGTTSTDELVTMVETEAKGGIDLTVLGYGEGNFNDSMLEQISGRGNGNYAFVDNLAEANRVLVKQRAGTLYTIARDVKIQVDFNPRHVAAYRLIGYENRKLNNEDFKDDTKDAGEIGAGHCVTALYELIPAGVGTQELAPEIDESKYQKTKEPNPAAESNEALTVRLRYKLPGNDQSVATEVPANQNDQAFGSAGRDLRLATTVAGFGMTLRNSKHIGNWTLTNVLTQAEQLVAEKADPSISELVEMIKQARGLVTSER